MLFILSVIQVCVYGVYHNSLCRHEEMSHIVFKSFIFLSCLDVALGRGHFKRGRNFS